MNVICIEGTTVHKHFVSDLWWKDSDYWDAPTGMRRYAPLFFKLLDLI